MQRRELITLLGGTAVVWPLTAGQQPDRMRRIGILARGGATERNMQIQQAALREGLAKLGWIEGRNVRFDLHYSDDDPDRLRKQAGEVVRLTPDVIWVGSQPAARLVLQRTQSIPVVFTNVGDPVSGGLLRNIARPEGNATGITSLYQSIAGKWLELLKEAAPHTTRVALVYAAEIVTEQYFAVMDSAAGVLGVKAIKTPYRNAVELERAIDAFAAEPNGGLLMVPPPPSASVRAMINRLAVKYRLPTIAPSKDFGPAEGSLMSYGSDPVEPSRIAATYVDRLLRGAKVSELPVQFPTKFELVVNIKTAKAIDLSIPEAFLLRADEVIE